MHEALALAGGTTAALAGLGLRATLSSQSQIWGPVLVAPAAPHQLALTFDDGPNPTATPLLLDVLARHQARATFFLIGDHVRREPALTRRIAAEGHLIGNHTQSHPWLPRYSSAFIRKQLEDCNATLQETLGQPVTLFRPPHGARRPAVLRNARELGLDTVLWNLIVGDWKMAPAATILENLRQGILRNQHHQTGTNLVLHDGGQHSNGEPRLPTVAAVEMLLAQLSPETEFVLPPAWQPG